MKTQNYAAALAVTGVLSLAGAVTAPVWAGGPDNGGQDKVGVCHRTASESNPYVYISVPEDEANGHITGTDKQHNQTVTWKTDGTWRGVPHQAGALRLDYYASSSAECEDTTPTTPPTTTPPTTTPPTTTPPTTPTTTAPTTPVPTTPAPTTPAPTTPAPTTTAPTTTAPPVTVSPSTAATTTPGGGDNAGDDDAGGTSSTGGGGGEVEVQAEQASTGEVTEQQPVPTAINAGTSASTTGDEILLPAGLATLGALLGLLALALRRRRA
jgi:hypothetical protein